MSVVRLLGNKRIFMALFGIAGLGGIRYALTPHVVRVYVDTKSTPELYLQLKKMLNGLSLRSLGANGILKLMKEQYPFIESVTISYASSLQADITVNLYKPLLIVASTHPGESEYVLSRYGSLFHKRHYNEDAVSGLPRIYVDGPFEEKKNDSALIKCALELQSGIVENYAITWRSKSDIELRAHALPIIINADETTIHDKERYTYVHRIFAKEQDRYKEGMKADIRLSDEIICSPLSLIKSL